MTEDIIRKQREFFRSGATIDVQRRIESLKALKKTIAEMQGEIAEALKADLGKSCMESYMCETGMVLSEIGDTLKHIGKWSRKRKVRTPAAQFPAKSYIIPEPYGCVLVMSPWNYPFLLCMSPLASAVAAGNTVVLKPSAYSPSTCAVVREIVEKCFSEEYVAVVEGGREVNAGLLKQKFDYIFFTGSKTVGKTVMAEASVHLTPVTLELGGKSPVIVDSDAAVEISARRTVFGKFLNCGQTCVAPDHVFVHEHIAKKFMEACVKEKNRMFGVRPLENGDYGNIINAKHFRRLSDTLNDSIQNGARILCGGISDAKSFRMEPTILLIGSLEDCSEDGSPTIDRLLIMQDEIFGPLMPVITYRDIDKVAEYIDGHPRPLATYIFSENRNTVSGLLKRLHFGGGCVNDTIIHIATENMPFGGVGESGMGNYHGKYGFETFSHLKSIVDKPSWLDLPFRYQPYSGLKDKIVRMFMK